MKNKLKHSTGPVYLNRAHINSCLSKKPPKSPTTQNMPSWDGIGDIDEDILERQLDLISGPAAD